MRLRQYANKMAFRWWKAGKLDAFQLDTGTVIVRESLASEPPTNVALYARMSSADQKEDLERQMQGGCLEVIFPSDTDTDLVDDFIAVITSMASRIYSRRTSKQRAEQIKQCVEHAMKAEDKA